MPGLAAKPIVDILLVVADSSDENTYLPFLESSGYSLRIREPEWHEHRMFEKTNANVNLHIISSNCPEIDRVLIFRDWLRANIDDRNLYERTKRALARQEWKKIQDYADAKTVVIEKILRRARL